MICDHKFILKNLFNLIINNITKTKNNNDMNKTIVIDEHLDVLAASTFMAFALTDSFVFRHSQRSFSHPV